jgi:HEAT repeat protein
MSFTHALTLAVTVAAAAPALAQSPAVLEQGVRQSTRDVAPAFRDPEDWEQATREDERKAREVERQRRDRERLADLYDRGMDATYEGRYDRALEAFSRLAGENGPRTDAALYWKAYSENKLGRRADALATIAELTKAHPKSGYVKDARALEVEIRNTGGQAVTPAAQQDDDLKLIAIMSMQHSAPEEAVPMLEQVLRGTASPRVKERALYVLALSNAPQAREVLIRIARGDGSPELQSRAIRYLGIHGGRESRAALADVYAASNDVDIKRRILRAFMISGERDRLLTAAQSEKDPELRSTAVEQLGVMGAHDALWQLYQKEPNLDVKRQILRAMFVGGDATRLIEIARTEQNPALRLSAVRNLGIMGQKKTGEALVQIYGTDKDPSVKKAVVEALFVQSNAAALVSLARKEQDPAMKKALVERLSLMPDKVARDYMLELLK